MGRVGADKNLFAQQNLPITVVAIDALGRADLPDDGRSGQEDVVAGPEFFYRPLVRAQPPQHLGAPPAPATRAPDNAPPA